MLAQRSDSHHSVYKVRRCFLWRQTYFQLDIYKVPCNSRCFGLILLETYSTLTADELKRKLPPFLAIDRDVTNEVEFSMYHLAAKTVDTAQQPGHTIATTAEGNQANDVAAADGTTNGSSFIVDDMADQ